MKYDGMTIAQIVREVNRLRDDEILQEMFEYPEIYEQVNKYLLDKKRRSQNRKRIANEYENDILPM